LRKLKKKMKFFSILATILGLSVASANASSVTPLDSGSWFQFARIADDGLGMHDGNSQLDNAYSFGVFTSGSQGTDFYRPFDVYAGMEIMFITGDRTIWAKTDYSGLKALIDASGGSQAENILFDTNTGSTMGNVLSRGSSIEDPWISMSGTHSNGISNGRIVWGENNWGSGGLTGHSGLKNLHGGMDVFVSTATVPLPAGFVLLLTAGAGVGAMRMRKKA
jgi:hypothetical protein